MNQRPPVMRVSPRPEVDAMKNLKQAILNWQSGVTAAWNQFWFRAEAPHTLAVIRILAGGACCCIRTRCGLST